MESRPRPECDHVFEEARRIVSRDEAPRMSISALVRCITETTGRDPFPELETFDVESDIEDVADQLGHLLRQQPPPPDMMYLLVSTSPFMPKEGKPAVAMCSVQGSEDVRSGDPEWPDELSYCPRGFWIQSALLDGILRRLDDAGTDAETIALALFEPAVGVVFRGAVRELGLPYAVVVLADDWPPCRFVLQGSNSS